MKLYEEQMSNRNVSDNYVTNDVKHPITLTDSNFSESVEKYPLLVVDFWAPWCGPCRMVTPVIEQLASELSGKVIFGKLNVDENPTVSGAFGIQSIPTIMIFKDGQVVDGFLGAVTKPQIMLKISQYL
jgi:thioredoxin 1